MRYGDVIAVRTRVGGMFIGVLLLAGATSLPEVLTTISSISQGVPNMAAGNLLGSNLFNMFLLAILDLLHRKDRILRKAALKHALAIQARQIALQAQRTAIGDAARQGIISENIQEEMTEELDAHLEVADLIAQQTETDSTLHQPSSGEQDNE